MSKWSQSLVAGLVSGVLLCGNLFSTDAQAAMISSQSAISQQAHAYDRASLISALDEAGVREQLSAMGVEAAQIEARIQTLTSEELAQLNQEIENLPAGQGILGILLTVFVVFVVTDLLCATNIFPFINCIR